MISAGMRSLSVGYPKTVRTNDYYRERFPEVVEAKNQKMVTRLFSKAVGAPDDAFLTEMAPYMTDAFGGSVERRVLAPGEKVLPLEVKAARDALAAAGMSAGDVDLIIASSFLPDQLGVGNAAFLARELGVKCAAWNLESACASSIVAFQTACGLVQAGQYKHVLVVASCAYSRVADDANPLSWTTGDGVGAFVVGKVKDGEGLLGVKTAATTETCSALYFQVDPGATHGPDSVVMCGSRDAGRIIHETAEPYLRACCMGALDDAGLKLRDVDLVVTNTPSAWYAAFVARALGIDVSRTIDTYPKYANIGSALMPANLYAAAEAGKIKPGSVVLLYGFGGVSTASAAVLRWGSVGLGTSPSSAG